MCAVTRGRPGVRRDGTIGRALAVPGVRSYLGAYAVSRLGDKLYNVVQVVVTLRLTGAPGWVAVVLVAHALPYVLVKPFGGVLVDRVDRRRLMIWCDVLRLTLMLAFAALVAVRGPIWLILVVVFLTTAVGAPYSSALSVTVADLVPEDRLASANGVLGASTYVAVVGGPVIAGVILATTPDPVGFLVNGATFLVSALLVAGAPGARRGSGGTSGGASGGTSVARESYLAALRTGAGVVARDVVVRSALLVQAGSTFVLGLGEVLLPLVARDLLGTGESGMGFLTGATGVGGVLGAVLAARAARSARVLLAAGIAGMVAAAPLALLAVTGAPWPSYLVLALGGLGFVTIDVVMLTTLQRALPRHQLGRVDGLVSALGYAALIVGNVAAALLVALSGLRAALVVGAGLVVVTSAAVAVRHAGTRLGPSAASLPVLALLRGILSLRGLDEVRLEALAAAASPSVPVAAGEDLLVEGATADVVLLLESGTCDVLATVRDGVPLPEPVLVNQVSGPDLLGEIGVLHRRPRTATVRATSACVVRRVPAADFEAAVLPGAGLDGSAVGAGIAARLSRWSG